VGVKITRLWLIKTATRRFVRLRCELIWLRRSDEVSQARAVIRDIGVAGVVATAVASGSLIMEPYSTVANIAPGALGVVIVDILAIGEVVQMSSRDLEEGIRTSNVVLPLAVWGIRTVAGWID